MKKNACKKSGGSWVAIKNLKTGKVMTHLNTFGLAKGARLTRAQKEKFDLTGPCKVLGSLPEKFMVMLTLADDIVEDKTILDSCSCPMVTTLEDILEECTS